MNYCDCITNLNLHLLSALSTFLGMLSLFKIHDAIDLFSKFTLQLTTPPLNSNCSFMWLSCLLMLPTFFRFVVHQANTMLPFLSFTFGLKNVFACRDQFKVDISVSNTPKTQYTNYSVTTENSKITFDMQTICSESDNTHFKTIIVHLQHLLLFSTL